MNAVRVNRKSLGINFSARGEAEVLVWAPLAQQVHISLVNKDQKLELIPRESGYWSCTTPALVPGDQYYIEIDGKPFSDPASVHQPGGIRGPSEVVNLNAFHWSDFSWKNISLEDYIVYELHTGTFSEAGTFKGIQSKLPYLKELGITAVEIMPVAQFSGTRNWGYDGVFPFAVQDSYGGPVALQQLVDQCHQHGIAVVLDVVYNHIGPEGNILPAFGPYFTDKYKTPWGEAINFDDAHCDAVRKYFIENALMWLRDFHVDALRLDAVHAIKDFSATHFLKELRQHVDALMQETGRVHYLIAECDLNDRKYIDPQHAGGYGMNAQWIDEFHHALRVTSGNSRTGYYEDFNGIFDLAKAWKDAYVYDGQYSAHRKKLFGTRTEGLAGSKFVVFSQNHDQVGNRMLGERTSALISFELQKVLAACVLASPYVPMLFMGEEYGETNPFLYFVSHSGKELVEAVREGRRSEFAAFHQEGTVPDPQSEDTFNKSKLQWNLLEDAQHRAMHAYYRELIRLRKQLPALNKAGRDALDLNVFADKDCMVVNRWSDQQHVLCAFNFSGASQTLELNVPHTDWKLLLNSAAATWLGRGDVEFSGPLKNIQISPQSFLLFIREHV
jgi:maltooligosyltrehalose trehalohydrolase